MSWQPVSSSTEPSRCTRTCAFEFSEAKTYQLPFAIPRPRTRAGGRPLPPTVQLPVAMSPAFLFLRSQPIAFAPTSYCDSRTGLASFLRRTSSGSRPSFSASSSIADSSPKAPCEWPGARSGAAGPAFVKTSCSSIFRFGFLPWSAPAGPAVPAPPATPAEPHDL